MLAILERLLGDGLSLGSIAANVLYPGPLAQEPHVDDPYCDLHAREIFPTTLNASFFLGMDSLVMLDDLTAENGATALTPSSSAVISAKSCDRSRTGTLASARRPYGR